MGKPKGSPHGNRNRIEMELTEEDRQMLDRLLVAGRLTLDDLVKLLTDKGYSISRAGLGRYKQRFDLIGARLRASRAATAAMMQEMGESKQGAQGQLLVEMARDLAMEFLSARAAGGETLDPKEIALIGKGFAEFARAARLDQDFDVKIAEVKAAARAEASAEARARLEKLAPSGGRDPKEMTIQELEAAIAEGLAKHGGA